jgi:hypothetical protein
MNPLFIILMAVIIIIVVAVFIALEVTCPICGSMETRKIDDKRQCFNCFHSWSGRL